MNTEKRPITVTIKFHKSKKSVDKLLSTFENQECRLIVSEEICFETNDPTGWLRSDRKDEFQKKLNEVMGDDEFYFTVESITLSTL